MLSLPLSGAATTETRAFVRGRRSAWNPARAGWSDAGDRSDQADPGHRRAAGWAIITDRRSGHEVPRAEAAEESGLPGLRHASDRDPTDRLQRVLRNSR